ncbi:MAG: hypothetical protein VX681_13955 [Myxococcota bacterium]|nr:hypothetical protein [Myxococcota bacterium]
MADFQFFHDLRRARRQALLVALLVAGFALAASAESEMRSVPAYIDPGTGSFLVQALVAAVAGIAVTSRIYWTKIKGFLGLATEGNEGEESSRDDD